VNEKEGKRYEAIRKDITYSLDSQGIAYVAKLGDKQVVVINGIEGKPYDNIPRNIIATSTSFRYLGVKGNDIYLVDEKL